MNAIGIVDIIDIVLVATFLYGVYRLMRRSGAARIFSGIMVFLFAWFLVSKVFRLSLTSAIFDQIVSVGVIALVVIFQNEIRRFFFSLGSHKWLKGFNFFQSSSNGRDTEFEISVQNKALVDACRTLSTQKVGALIAIEQVISLDSYIETGNVVDADINTLLIENIFFKNSPLHDGAMIIRNHRIVSTACILPNAVTINLPQQFGLRHRAGIALSECTDAFVIIISEETGAITIAQNSQYTHDVKPEDLSKILARTVR